MKIFIEQVIDLPIQQVWQIFAVDFSDIQKWSNFVQTSAVKNEGELVDDASVVGRYCDTELGKLDETIKISILKITKSNFW